MEPLTLSALLGLIAVPVTAIITRSSWSSQTKRWTALGVYAAMTLVAWLATRFPAQWEAIATELAIVVTSGQVVYTIVKPLGWVEWIEGKTSSTGNPDTGGDTA
jgi:hypothetical protein